MRGFEFNGKHSYKDFGLKIASKEISNPEANLIFEEVPFMNGAYDFSMLYDEISYKERELRYEFWVIKDTKEKMNIFKIALMNWLKASEKKKLIDDAIPGFYFMAQVQNVEFTEENRIGYITITFTAYPFKIRTANEGEIPWDDFIFLIDVMQETCFEVGEECEIKLYNEGSKKITPRIEANSEYTLLKDGRSYSIQAGTTEDSRFKLDIGENIITIKRKYTSTTIIGENTKDTIKFIFTREVL